MRMKHAAPGHHRAWPSPLTEAGFVAARHPRRHSDLSSFEEAAKEKKIEEKKAQVELKIKEIDRQIEEQRSSERALAEQEEDQEKEMGDDAILSPEQEEAGLKAREISKQESAVVDKSQQLVNEKLELLKELKKLEDAEAAGKAEPGDTVEREIVGPAGEKEVEVVKEEPGGQEEVMEVKEETPEEAAQMADSGGEIVEPPVPAPAAAPAAAPATQEEFECPPCPPVPKARERPLMISAEDEPPGRAPRVEVNVTESYSPPNFTAPSLLLAPPAPVKTMRLSMPSMPSMPQPALPQAPQVIEQGTAGDDRIQWQPPEHVPLATIGSAPASLAGALMDEEVQDENEVPQEYDDEEPSQIDEVHEALRGGHAFKKMPVEQTMPLLAALLEPRPVPTRAREMQGVSDFL